MIALKKSLYLYFFVLTSMFAQSQETHYGPLIGLAQTTITTATGRIVIGGNSSGPEMKNTGYKSNVLLGGYFTIPFREYFFVGSEVIYNKTTSEEFQDVTLTHLQIIPTLGGYMFRTNAYIELGGGLGIMLEEEGLEMVAGNEFNEIDFSGKFTLGYHFKSIGRIDLSFYGSSDIVKDRAARLMFVISTKLQLDRLFKS